jgi:hypothetical protein
VKFDTVLKKLMKNPELEFSSRQANCEHQNLNSIEFWYFRDLTAFDQMIIAEDWKQEITSLKEKYSYVNS